MVLKQLVVATFIFVLIQVWCCDACLEDERLALLQLKASFNIYEDFFSTYDGTKSADCCDWWRIKCDAHTGRVTSLDLSDAAEWRLGDWYLNASLFLPFKKLSDLLLCTNRIKGCVENEGFERLQRLNNLKYLDLYGNNFNNDILLSLSGLSSLKSLNISYNKLNGSKYFEKFNNLKNLKELYMDGNEIKEFIFFNGGKLRLSNLETLSLRNNRFNNNVLSFLDNLSSLKNLHLHYNQLRGPFNVTELAALRNLEYLSLSGNKNISKFVASTDFTGPTNLNTLCVDDMKANGINLLLKSLAVFPYLKTLYLWSNNLVGSTFHHEFQCLKNVENLYLDGSVVDENFLVSLNALPSLKTLSYVRGSGFDILQGLCNLSHLQSLDLGNSNFSGGLPHCLANLSSLQYLDLSKNSLSGNLSSSPLGLMTHLQYLDLSWNNLAGYLSSSPLTLMTSIQYLYLHNNNFQIPISLVPFYNCSKLYYLSTWGNELYADIESHNLTPKFQLKQVYLRCDGCGGFFPRFLYHQHNLHEVFLPNNKIRGEFPYWLLENNTKLQRLDLSNNSLSGSIKLPSHSHVNLISLDISSNSFDGQIPTKIGSHFESLETLDMFDNEFSDSIPPSFGNMRSLSYLSLSNNQLSGNLPMFLGSSQLRGVYMSNNKFNGSIPPSIGNLRLLYYLDMSNNKLSGNLPMFLGSSQLRRVYLSKNMLYGSITYAFSKSSELTLLDLSHNFLTGNIPKWIGNLSGLNFLQLGHNYLKGEIPSEVCKLDQLSFIDLSNNNLYGHVPHCLKSSSISSRTNHTSYRIDQPPVEFMTKNMTHSYPANILILLSGIDLSCNKLIGQIPPELGNLTNIKVLNLSHNSLGGSIPSTFSNLEEIESLDLSHNNLTGKIPYQLTQLKSISFFSVANNNLSGKTPEMVKQFATFENSSYEGNPFLCGKPLSKSCQVTISPSPLPGCSANKEDDDGFMDMGVFYISFVVSYVIMLLGIVAVLCINPYWRRSWFYFVEVKMADCYYFIVDLFKL